MTPGVSRPFRVGIGIATADAEVEVERHRPLNKGRAHTSMNLWDNRLGYWTWPTRNPDSKSGPKTLKCSANLMPAALKPSTCGTCVGQGNLIKAYNVIERCMISSARRLPGAKLPQLRNKAGTLGKTSKCSTWNILMIPPRQTPNYSRSRHCVPYGTLRKF
jgi:hypothetical protein